MIIHNGVFVSHGLLWAFSKPYPALQQLRKMLL